MTSAEIFGIIFISVIVLNFLMLIFMIFLEKRKPQSIITWMFIFTFMPIIGFIFYAVLGSGLSFRTRRMMKKTQLSQKDLINSFDWKKTLTDLEGSKELFKDKELVSFCFEMGAYPCFHNDVQIYNNGMEKIASLKEDLLNAKKSINIEYYIFANDKVGKEIMNILCDKAKQGVDVRLVYDAVGSKRAPRRFFNQLKKAGGKVAEFFPPFLGIRLIQLKVNYRNHRKIVVIDGKIAYTGGVNIRDDHMGFHRRLSPWRDTHIRIEGSGAGSLQNIFLNDFRYALNDKKDTNDYINQGFFPEPSKMGDVALQVLSCGPNSYRKEIRDAYVKMVISAKKRICIQTPYFVPDEMFYNALKIAKNSGVEIKIMIPKKPDKRIVYLPTLSYAKEMADLGIEIFLYNGFIHSKTIIIDDDKLSIGTCNIDNRSFELNFENTVMIYSKKKNKEYSLQFETDILSSQKADKIYFKKYPLLGKMGQALFRLLSPIL